MSPIPTHAHTYSLIIGIHIVNCEYNSFVGGGDDDNGQSLCLRFRRAQLVWFGPRNFTRVQSEIS